MKKYALIASLIAIVLSGVCSVCASAGMFGHTASPHISAMK